MKLFNRNSKTAAVVSKSLQIMKVCLMIAVGVIAGVIVIAYAGEALLALGSWLLTIAFYMAVGMAVISLTTGAIGMVAAIVMGARDGVQRGWDQAFLNASAVS